MPRSRKHRRNNAALPEACIGHVILLQSAVRRWQSRKELKQRVKMISKRKNVANELLHTEKEYVSNLNTLLKNFLRPIVLTQAKLLEAQLSNEFALSLSGVEIIFKFHQELLNELEGKLKTWNPSSELGALFLPMAFYLKSYSTYVNHYQNVVQLLAKRKMDKNLQNMLESLKPQSAGKGIKDFLIMPIQRIPRYQMLLHELVKATWETHNDYQNLVQAQDKVQAVAVDLENQSADACSIAKVVELSSTLSRFDDNFKLLVPHRRYIDEVTCSAAICGSTMSLTAFLFNDLLILAKSSKKDKYSVKRIVEMKKHVVESSSQIKGRFRFKGIGDNSLVEEFVITVGEELHTKWKNYFVAVAKEEKVWLPHVIENEDGKISIQAKTQENLLIASPASKKKRMKLGFMKASKELSMRKHIARDDFALKGPGSRKSDSVPEIFSAVMQEVKIVGGVTPGDPWQARRPNVGARRASFVKHKSMSVGSIYHSSDSIFTRHNSEGISHQRVNRNTSSTTLSAIENGIAMTKELTATLMAIENRGVAQKTLDSRAATLKAIENRVITPPRRCQRKHRNTTGSEPALRVTPKKPSKRPQHLPGEVAVEEIFKQTVC